MSNKVKVCLDAGHVGSKYNQSPVVKTYYESAMVWSLHLKLKAALEEKGYHFTYDDALVDYLVKKSYSAAYGARNLRRCIQKDVEDPMAARIIESYETPITQIKATAEDGAVELYTL